MRKLFALFATSFFMSAMSAQAQIPEHGFYWWGNKAYFDSAGLYDVCLKWEPSTSTCNHPTQMRSYSAFLAAANAEYSSTDIDAGVGPNGEGKIEFINIYHPFVNAQAATQPFSGTTSCAVLNANYDLVENGNCNKTTARATTAKIFINDRFVDDRYNPGLASDLYWTFGDIIIRHELGHALGMNHNDSGLDTFMKSSPTATTSKVLHFLERTWINNHY